MHQPNAYKYNTEAPGPTFEAEYLAVLAKADALGYTKPSESQQAHQNTLLAALKAAGIWSKLDFLYINVNDGSKNFAQINWKDPDNFNKDLSGWDFTSNVGVALAVDGASRSAADTNYNPTTDAVNYALNNASYGYKLGAAGADPFASSDYVFRATPPLMVLSLTSVFLRLNQSSNWSFSSAGGTISATSDDVFVVVNRPLSNTLEYYRNAVLEKSSAAINSSGLPNTNILLADYTGTITNIYELEFCGASLSATEVSNFYSAFNTYLAAI